MANPERLQNDVATTMADHDSDQNDVTSMADPGEKLPLTDVSQELTEAVGCSQWTDVVRLVHSCSEVAEDQRHWSLQETARRAPERFVDDRIEDILGDLAGHQLYGVLSHLLQRRLWTCVGRVLQRDTSGTQPRPAVAEALKHADEHAVVNDILPHCRTEELEEGLTHLVSRCLWLSVDKVLERGVDAERRRWVVEEAWERAPDDDFAYHILPHCTEEDMERVYTLMMPLESRESEDSVTQGDVSITRRMLSMMVSRRQWRAVGRFLQRDIDEAEHLWAVEQGGRYATEPRFVHYVLPQCRAEELGLMITALISRGLWWAVDEVLKRMGSATKPSWVVAQAAVHANDAIFERVILSHYHEDYVFDVFPLLVAQGKRGSVQHIVNEMARETLYTWMTSEHGKGIRGTVLWKFVHDCHVDVSLALDLLQTVTHKAPYTNYMYDVARIASDVAERVSWQVPLCKTLAVSFLHAICHVVCSDDTEYTDGTEDAKQCVSNIYTSIFACIRDNANSIKHNALKTIQNKQKWTLVFTEIADVLRTDPLFLIYFLQGLNLYHCSRRGETDDAILLVILAVFPLIPQLQSVALRMMLSDGRWDVISQACLSHVWEHDRRRLFKAAVMQRQWAVVRQWCDHTVLDDQRHWALTEAFKQKQWDVYLLLADHGFTVAEQMHAHYMVAKYGDWNTVLDMVERAGDITEVSNLLEMWVTGKLRKKPEGDVTAYVKRCEKLIRLRLRFAQKSAISPRKALERCMWGSVLFNILHKPTEYYVSRVVDKVIEEQKWHILMHLVRVRMKATERDRLFPEMVRLQQWGVCRMLLQYGVDIQLCLEALPGLMERNQWMLVAMVMEYDVDDAVRRQVMHCAFEKRAGALFWHCLTTMEDQERLSMEMQETLFHQAISRDIWQAVKPMVEEKDGSGIRRRDMAFLEAIEQHLWDVVDYCQLHKADINMKDENGETPLNREARKEEWKAVEEIVLRDGDPNHLDKDGVSVLNRLIDHGQWDAVKIVIMYGGDIHFSAKYHQYYNSKHTPLQALINTRQAGIIQFSMSWCGDQKKGLNARGETVLHAACDSDRWDVMWDFIVRSVDPLAVTCTGQTPLVYAVLNTQCPERMVAECCRLGFSTHQPSLTGPQDSVLHDIACTVFWLWKYYRPFDYINSAYLRQSQIVSPLVCAVLLDLPVVALMLYESGSSSNAELLTLFTQLPKLTDLNTQEGKKYYDDILTDIEEMQTDRMGRHFVSLYLLHYDTLKHIVEKYTGFLREVATTPRTLLSSCRLLISHGFHCRDKRRHEYVDELPLPEVVQNFLLFSEFRDPDYGRHLLQ